ncbi:MAG: pyridoxal phosphate-dependent aminotransferase [Gracilimonas sp.]|uniref:pyridoxal phosphate-dependent aminotransferase n=1 Tax=Gracilimonas TaxID=649462 RepID=UPI001B214D11|nr:pyridoxal phosphate-dependent aminotransferase [Gracilimonas sp.]MBO6584609.1 pyridoxal phosphate-dependent aminotransferase [Gracilimonas sp.]MBO6616120.1 pyridoxal phosphate-dependent aminotransferase [Gracilimonas sp.]
MISNRAQNLQPSATLKVTGRAKELKRQGKSIVSLSAGEPDFKTPKHICDAAIKAIEDGFHGYTMNPGTPELREAICAKLKRDNNLDYDPSQIICSNGAKQSVGFSLLALVNPGDEVIIPAPYWVSYPEMTRLAEGESVTVRTSFENNFKLTPQQLEDAITEKTKALILCSPSNPTGAQYTADELEGLAEVLRKHPQVYVISDEIYEYIVFEGDHVSILNVAPDLKDRVLLINGFSKGFAMTGWRLGYLAASNEIVSAVSKIQSQETSAPSSISQKAGEAAYKGSLEEVETMREQFKKRRDYLVETLNSLEGVSCFTPGGAFYVFPDISHYIGSHKPDGSDIESSTDLCLYLLDEFGLALVPGDAFGEPSGVRLSYAASMDDLEEAMKRFEKGLSSLK